MILEQIILIIDSTGTRTIENDSGFLVINTDNMETAGEIIEKYEPDLILVYDNSDKNITEICTEIRNKKNLYRPILVVLSDEKSLEKKLEVIKAGADDFQSMSANDEEISLRIFAHLRRHVEESFDPVTKLPVTNSIYKIIKRNIELNNQKKNDCFLTRDDNQDKNEFIAVMCLDINNYISYKEIYGYIAAEKLLQTFTAIVKTSINENDFLGQISENGFIILTTPEKAEKMAIFLSYSFDNVAPKFYSHEDAERGYLLLAGDDKIGRRMPFVSISIGISSNQYNTFNNYQEALNSSRNIQRLAKSKRGSCWISDRPKISGGDIIEKNENKILIAEQDAALAYLLSTTLEMQGYIVETVNNTDEIIDSVRKNKINLILLDIANSQVEGTSCKELEICKCIKQDYPYIKVIVSTVNRNKENVLNSGADLYIPKPYELMTLFNWVDRFLNDEL